MIIKRQTRQDIEITTIDELILYINKIGINKLKRQTSDNLDVLFSILSAVYTQNTAFKKEMLKLWKPAYKNLKLFGWNDKEISDEIQTRTDIKKKALATALRNSGLTEKEYRRTLSNVCPEYWIKRGFTPTEAIIKVEEVQSNNSKKASNQQKRESSPRTLDYWIKKGVSNPEERRQMWQKESSQRCPEYWMSRGCSYEEAVKMVSEKQRASVRLYYDNTPEAEIRAKNIRCPEYYRAKGMSEDEIKQRLKDNGRTFSLEICQAKYGEDEGYVIWEERQRKWQQTLNNKSPDELEIIRQKQGVMQGRKWDSLHVPGIFYIIQISLSRVKIGITIRDIDERYPLQALKDKRIHTHKVDDIQTAYLIEQIIKRRHITEIKKADYGVFGWTEVLQDSFENILSELTELINTKDNLNLLLERMMKNENYTVCN